MLLLVSSSKICPISGGSIEEVGTVKVYLMITMHISGKYAEMVSDLVSEMLLLYHFSFLIRQSSELRHTDPSSLAEQECIKDGPNPGAIWSC